MHQEQHFARRPSRHVSRTDAQVGRVRQHLHTDTRVGVETQRWEFGDRDQRRRWVGAHLGRGVPGQSHEMAQGEAHSDYFGALAVRSQVPGDYREMENRGIFTTV